MEEMNLKAECYKNIKSCQLIKLQYSFLARQNTIRCVIEFGSKSKYN